MTDDKSSPSTLSDEESPPGALPEHEYGGHPEDATMVDLYHCRTNEEVRHIIRSFAGLGNLEKDQRLGDRVAALLHRPDHVVLTSPCFPWSDVYSEKACLGQFIDEYMRAKGYSCKDFDMDFKTTPYIATTYWIDDWCAEKAAAKRCCS